MTDAQVSVIMPARNGERYIEPALRSLLRESALGLDIIVVDDASTDGTAAIVRRVAASSPGVRLLDGPGLGVSQARNVGLAAVPLDRPCITFLDCDDLSPPGRIGRQLAFLQGYPEVRCVTGMVQFFEAAD